MIDHYSYTHDFSNCEIKALKKIRPKGDSKLLTSAMLVHCSTNTESYFFFQALISHLLKLCV